MELTPDLLLEAKFSAARRGYDMAEVDDFLERCAEGLDVLLARLRAEFDRAERAEAELASPHAPGTRAPADVDVAPDAFAPEPEPEPDPVSAAVVQPPKDVATERDDPVSVGEPMRILIHAERTAEAAIAEALAEAERIRSEAESLATSQRTEAESLLEKARTEAESEARRAGDETRRALQGEVVTLRRDRDALTQDIRSLRRWLDDQRGRLRTTARDLQRLADDPGALQDVPPPEITEIDGAPEAPVDESGPDGASGPVVHDDVPSDGEPTQAVPAYGGDTPVASNETPFDVQADDSLG